MEIERTGPSTTILKLNDGGKILFSYDVPVAAYKPGRLGFAYVKSAKYFSRTTSGHVSKWLRDEGAPEHVPAIPHDELLKITREAR